jgi:hypothetical protein
VLIYLDSGFGISAIVYYALNRLSPVPGKSSKFVEVDVCAEEVEEVVHEDTKKAVEYSRSSDEEM